MMPERLTVDILCQDVLNDSQSRLTGKQIWETIWDTTTQRIKNLFLPNWYKLVPLNGQLSSGFQNHDPALLAFRKVIYDIDINQQFLKNNPKPTTNFAAPTSPVTSSLITSSSLVASPTTAVVTSMAANFTDVIEIETSMTTIITESKKKSGRPQSSTLTYKEFDPNWFPLEWMAFVALGPISKAPCHIWSQLELSQGPQTPGRPLPDPIGREEQRKRARN
jgi:hypothetical protein